jgi:hypothetical protein
LSFLFLMGGKLPLPVLPGKSPVGLKICLS